MAMRVKLNTGETVWLAEYRSVCEAVEKITLDEKRYLAQFVQAPVKDRQSLEVVKQMLHLVSSSDLGDVVKILTAMFDRAQHESSQNGLAAGKGALVGRVQPYPKIPADLYKKS